MIKLIINESLNEQANDFTDITLYHGTNSDFDKFDIEKAGTVQRSDWGKGIYFTRSKWSANNYRIEAVKRLSKEYNGAYDEYEKIHKELEKTQRGTDKYKELEDLSFQKLNDFRNIGKELNSTKEGRLITAKIKSNAKVYNYNSGGGMTDPYLADEVKLKGYDIVCVDEGKFMEEFVVMNPNSIIITGEIKDNL